MALLCLVAACSGDDDDHGDAAPGDPVAGDEEIRLNEVQFLGSHNSYHLEPEPEVLTGIEVVSPALANAVEYSHLPLAEQLEDHGIRNFELDVFADPEGGLYANRQALPVISQDAASGEPALDEPGFKVLHTQDFDFRTTCLTFVDCLDDIRGWSDDNPSHLPITIYVEVKTDTVEEAAADVGVEIPADLPIDFTVPVDMTPELFEALEEEITSVFPTDRLITPDDVRGDAATLREAVLAGNAWPTIDEARGRVMFVMVNGDESRDVYRQGNPSLEGRLVFTQAEPGDPDQAVVNMDSALTGSAGIMDLVQQGFLGRARTDADTIEARSGDIARRDASFDSGAQFLATDYYVEDPDLGTGFVVSLPGGGVARCNPVNTPPGCSAEALVEPG